MQHGGFIAARTGGGRPVRTGNGLRHGEAGTMRRAHVGFSHQTLLIPETKAGTPRQIPLSRCAMAVQGALPRWPEVAIRHSPDSTTQAFERACLRADGGDSWTQGAGMLKRYTHLRMIDLVRLLD